MKYLFLIGILFCVSLHVFAQKTITWEKQIHIDSVLPNCVAIETEDSGYFVVAGKEGLYRGYNIISGKLLLIKLNKYGNEQWIKILDSGNIVYPVSIIRKEPGVYLLMTEGYIPKSNQLGEINLIEFDSIGNITWSNKDTSNIIIPFSFPYQIISKDKGGYILSGELFSDSGPNGNYKMFVQMYNRSHHLRWSDTFTILNTSLCEGIIFTRDKRIMIEGATWQQVHPSIYGYNFNLLIDTNGRQVNYIHSSFTRDSTRFGFFLMVQLKNGDIQIEDFLDCDSIGNLLFTDPIKINPSQSGGFMAGLVADGDSIVMLYSNNYINISKYDNHFNLIWNQDFDDSLVDDLANWYNVTQTLIKTSDGGYLISFVRQDTANHRHLPGVVLIKLNAQGNFKNDQINTTCRLVYPNPSSSLLHIDYTGLDSGASYYLEIYNCNGKLVNKYQLSGQTEEDINISNLSNGLYLYRYYNGAKTYCSGKFVKE